MGKVVGALASALLYASTDFKAFDRFEAYSACGQVLVTLGIAAA